MNGIVKGILIAVGVAGVAGLGVAAYKYMQPDYIDDFEDDFDDYYFDDEEDSEPVGDVCYD